MRAKTKRLVITFPTTSAAMAMEKRCAAANIPGRLMPTPRALSADCGICWRGSIADRTAAEQAAAGLDVEQMAEVLL